jgi:hypothetical protein
MKSADEFSVLDRQLARWRDRLTRELRVPPAAAEALASTIVQEIADLDRGVRTRLRPVGQVSLKDRLSELVAFQAFMDSVPPNAPPQIVRAQVIVQNYICFVYLGEAYFSGPSEVRAARISNTPMLRVPHRQPDSRIEKCPGSCQLAIQRRLLRSRVLGT